MKAECVERGRVWRARLGGMACVVAAVFSARCVAGGELDGPYVAARHLTAVPFGKDSHWHQPWRAWMETVPADRFLDAIGIVSQHRNAATQDLLFEHFARHGLRTVRFEIGWGKIDVQTGELKSDAVALYGAKLRAAARHGVRPIILLNAHHGWPTPHRSWSVRVMVDAAPGDGQLTLQSINHIVPHYTGLKEGGRMGRPMITSVEGNVVTLSAPLEDGIEQGGWVRLYKLKYRPFSEPGTEMHEETIAGWQHYVRTVAQFAAKELGTTGGNDLGFDLEIWNEMTFGSDFLDINNYYDPPFMAWNPREIFQASVGGQESLIYRTVETVEAHPELFAGVMIGDGFGNTLPWQGAGTSPDRVRARGRHPYPKRRTFPGDDRSGTSNNLNALSQRDGSFVPSYSTLFPEYGATLVQTESILRDCAPMTTWIGARPHGRFARRGSSEPFYVWITEAGYMPREDGVDGERAWRLKTKAALRYWVFYPHKGVEKVTLFADDRGGDAGFSLVSPAFFRFAQRARSYPADDSAITSMPLTIIRRIVERMSEGLDRAMTAQDLDEIRVLRIADDHDHFVFEGDGTPEHPTLYHRDVLTILPYQVNASRLVIPYYVMTRDIREDLAPELFTIDLAGIDEAATLSVYDPWLDDAVPLAIVSREQNKITLELEATDYPRLLMVDEVAGVGGDSSGDERGSADSSTSDGSGEETAPAPTRRPSRVWRGWWR